MGTYPDEYYRSSYLSPSSFNNSWFLLMLRMMLIYETDDHDGKPDKLRLGWFTPRAWLEHGKEIKVAGAPTMFGTLDYNVRSEIDNGKVHITMQMPDRNVASEVSLRLRVPGKKTIKSVTVNGKSYKAFDAADETIDLTGRTGRLDMVVDYEWSDITGMSDLERQKAPVYPNPVQPGNTFYIRMESKTIVSAKVEIFNETGQMQYMSTGYDDPICLKAPDVQGVYFIRITNDKQNQMYKLVVI